MKIYFVAVLFIFIAFRFFDYQEVKKANSNFISLLRDEFLLSNSYALSKAIVDIEKSGQFKCIKLLELEPTRIFYESHEKKTCTIFRKYNLKLNSIAGTNYVLSYSFKFNFTLFFVEILFYIFTLLLIYINSLKLNLEKEKNNLLKSELQTNVKINDLAKKMAHDIRSPLSTLNLISSKIEDAEISELQLAVTKKIDMIAGDLLKSVKQVTASKDSFSQNLSVISFYKLIKKEYELKSQIIDRKIDFFIHKEIKDKIFSRINVVYPILNNLIQNAIEATNSINGRIDVRLLRSKNMLLIQVQDNGHGIPEYILNKLGKMEITTKQTDSYSGSGIAIYNAKKDLEAVGGSMKISSKNNLGTDVEILIPLMS